MHHTEPLIATVVTNPTNRSLKYTWLGKSGIFVKAKSSVIVPFDVYTAATPVQRKMLATAVNTKMVELSYQVNGVSTTKVDSIQNRMVHGEAVEKAKAEAKKKAKVKEEPKVEEEPKPKKRTQIINAVEEGEGRLKDAEDLVQKATGQKTVTMRDAMGWEKPETDDPRTVQKAKDIDMEDALTENVGDPIAKLAKAEAAKEAAAAKKRSEAAKKAAATRKKNREAKKKAAAKNK